MSDRELARVARRQHGLITVAQLNGLLRKAEVRHRVERGRLERVHTGVYRVGGAAESWEQLALAAVCAAGDGAVASFRGAAYLWQLAGFWQTPAIEITTPSRRRVRLADVVVHDSMVLDGPHVGRRRGVPVTSVARTLCDLTAVCWSNEVGRALDDALRRRIVSLRALRAVFDDLATRGRRRSTLMRALLDERAPTFDPGGSDPEVRMVRCIVGAGLPRPTQQHVVRTEGRTYRLDAAYPEFRVGIEYEGFDFHVGRTAFDDRYERDRLLKHAGWWIVYVTSRTTSARLVDDVRFALEQRGWRPPPSIM